MKNLNRIKPSFIPETYAISSKQGQAILIHHIEQIGDSTNTEDIIKKNRMVQSMIDVMIKEIQSI